MPTVEIEILRNGLVVEADVHVSAPWRERMYRRGLGSPPPAVRCSLLIDTGCDTTMINAQTLRALGLAPTSETRVVTATSSSKGELCKVYGVDLALLPHHHQPPVRRTISVVERELLNQGIEGLLGRDVLAAFVLEYDGPRGNARLNW